jgi:hypothetical protein
VEGKKYIHYGHKSFDRNRFAPIRNRRCFTKPDGGLWASPVDAEFGWKQWCDENEFRECNMKNSFTFTLTPEARVLRIDTTGVLDALPQIKDEFSYPGWCQLDFEKLLEQGYDAVELVLSANYQLYWTLYGWDCDSIVVMNPDVIVEVSK